MRRLVLAVPALLLGASLAGCSAFYPNWGATGLPEDPEVTQTQVEQLPAEDPADSATSSPAPDESETDETAEPDPEATQTPVIERVQTPVEIIMVVPEPDFGVLTVVAQIPGISEAGGYCTMRFIGADQERTMEVRAEPSSDYTQCFPIEFPLSDLPSGNGIVTVSYESERHFGTSPASSVVIP